MVLDGCGQFLVSIVSRDDRPPLVKTFSLPANTTSRGRRGRGDRVLRSFPRIPLVSDGWGKDAALAPRRRPSPYARTILFSEGHAIFANVAHHETVLLAKLPPPHWPC